MGLISDNYYTGTMFKVSSAKLHSIEVVALDAELDDISLRQGAHGKQTMRNLCRLKLQKVKLERWGQLSGLIGTEINMAACCLPCTFN